MRNLFNLTGVALLLSVTLGACHSSSDAPNSPSTPEPSSETIFKVDINARQQQLRFIGSDMERGASHMQKAKSPIKIAQLAFGDVNFSICRVSFDKQQEMVEGVKNMEFYDGHIQSMKDLRKVNPHIEFWGTLKSDYDGYGDNSNLPDWICSYPHNATPNYFYADKYAKFLADYLELMESEGVGLSYIAVAKEWSTFITPAITVEIIKNLKAECETRKIKMPKITDPAAWSISQGIAFVEAIKKSGDISLFHCLTTHNYNKNETKKFKDFVTAVKSSGGDCFPIQDETNYGAGSRMTADNPNLEMPTLQQLMDSYSSKAEMYRDGMAGELIFEPFSRGVDSERRGIHFKKNEDPTFMRAYFCMKEYVNSIAPKNDKANLEYAGYVNPKNKYYVKTTKGVGLSSVEVMSFANDDEVAVCVINRSTIKDLKDVVFEIEGASKVNSAKGRWFNQSISIEGVELADIETEKNRVMLGDIASESIVFFTVQL